MGIRRDTLSFVLYALTLVMVFSFDDLFPFSWIVVLLAMICLILHLSPRTHSGEVQSYHGHGKLTVTYRAFPFLVYETVRIDGYEELIDAIPSAPVLDGLLEKLLDKRMVTCKMKYFRSGPRDFNTIVADVWVDGARLLDCVADELCYDFGVEGEGSTP